MKPIVLVILAVALLVVAAPATATDVIAPADGAIVSSQPSFSFAGVGPGDGVEIEVARDPTVLTAGDRAGQFVDRVDGELADFGDDPAIPTNTVVWDSGRLLAGRYYWHAQVLKYDGTGSSEWSSIRAFIVRDDPAIFEGWTLHGVRLPASERCPRLRLSGVVAWTDNDPTPTVRLSLSILARGRTLTARRPLEYGGDQFSVVICSLATRLGVTPTIVDRAGQVTPGEPRTVAVPGSATFTHRDATSYVRSVLAKRFKGDFKLGYWLDRRGKEHKPVVRCTRRSSARFNCHTQWNIGDLGFRGTVKTWVSRETDGDYFNHSMRIKLTDYYCKAQKRRGCTRTYVVR